MSQICQSRLAQVCIISTPIALFFWSRLVKPYILILLGSGSVLAGIFSNNIRNAIALLVWFDYDGNWLLWRSNQTNSKLINEPNILFQAQFNFLDWVSRSFCIT